MKVTRRGDHRAIVHAPNYIGYVVRPALNVQGGWQAHVCTERGDHEFVGWSARRADAVNQVEQERQR